MSAHEGQSCLGPVFQSVRSHSGRKRGRTTRINCNEKKIKMLNQVESSKSGKILDVQLTGCEETDICELKRGETYTYQIQFESLTDSESAKTVVHGIVNGVSMPFPVQNPNACENGNLDCPLETGKSYTYLNEVEVRKSYPSVR
ncbi:Protein NPC2-like protein, partial [Stegodyphus mimosarum]